MKRCITYKTILIPKNWTILLNYNRQFNDTTIKKGYKIYLQVECHFSYYYSHQSIIYCNIHRKTNYIWGQPNASPLRQLEKVNSEKILHEMVLFEKLRFLILDNQFKLFNNNYTAGKIILYLFKHLD